MEDLEQVKPIAEQEIIVSGKKPEDYKYPFPKSHQVVFYAEAKTCNELKVQLDSVGRVFLSIKEL
jgi:hypothetical protein